MSIIEKYEPPKKDSDELYIAIITMSLTLLIILVIINL